MVNAGYGRNNSTGYKTEAEVDKRPQKCSKTFTAAVAEWSKALVFERK